jgi:hypothetical protein
VAILFVSVCAVVSGARSFAAIAEWAADALNDAVDDTAAACTRVWRAAMSFSSVPGLHARPCSERESGDTL